MRSSCLAKIVIALEALTIAGFVVVAGGLLLVLVARRANTSIPQVSFVAPSLGDVVEGGNPFDVHVVGSDPDGITRLELWVDGQLLEVVASALPGGSTPLPMVTEWRPGAAGSHTLVVRAVDIQGKEGVAEVVVEAIEGPQPPAFRMEQGETTLPAETIAEIEEASPGLLDSLAEQGTGLVPAVLSEDEEEDEAPPPPPSPDDGPPILAAGLAGRLPGIGALLGGIRLDAEPERLEVEAVSLETSDSWFENYYCYIQLDDLIERVPAEGSLQITEDRFWDIAAYAGGENRRSIPVPEDAVLDVYVQCLVNGNPMGEIRAGHASDEWDGRLLEKAVSDGPYWYKISYRIRWAGGGGDGTVPAPTGLTYYCHDNPFLHQIFCELSWHRPTMIPQLGHIKGYIVMRDGEYVYQIDDPGRGGTMLTESDGVPPCGVTYEYRVVAFAGDPTDPANVSAPSYPVFLSGMTCPRQVRVDFHEIAFMTLAGDCWTGVCENSAGKDCAKDGYAKLWANDELIRVCGRLGIGWVLCDFDCFDSVSVAEFPGTEGGSVTLSLKQEESVEIAFEVRDYDEHTGNDLECAGRGLISPEEIAHLATLPEEDRRYVINSDRGGGSCSVRVSVTELPALFPSIEGRTIGGP